MKLLQAVGLACLMFFSVTSAKADDCDDISKLADQWHKLANYIDNNSDDGKLRKAQIAKVSKDTKALAPGTKELGDVLAKEAKGKDLARVRALGKQISAAIDELGALGEGDDWDEDVKIIDRLVEILDKVADWCATV
jgi:hypothetical protein